MSDLTLHKLQERVKELTALHTTARLLQDHDRPPVEVVREIVSLLPPAWQYPEITAARICFQDVVEMTPGWRETPWIQTARFVTRSHDEGTIEVVYLEERPPEAEGPFLAEERDLIDSLAEMLHSYFDRKLADAEIRAAYDNLEQLVQTRTAELQTTNSDLEREVSRHQQARRMIDKYQSRLRQMATEITLSDARERREIAVALHDNIIQEFAFIKLRIAQFRGDAIFCGFERNLEEIISLLEGAIKHTRELTFEISTPILYELGLTAALEWLAEQYEARHKLKITVKAKKIPRPLAEAVRVTLFKCVQELLTNAVKYANAKSVNVTLRSVENRLELCVTDDGQGFDITALEPSGGTVHGFGLFSIRERLKNFGGGMALESREGKGTIVTLTIPLEV